MCGRYYVDDETAREIEKVVREAEAKLQICHRGDICPSSHAAVLTGKKPQLTAEEMIWGFPNDQRKGLLINARAESVLEKRTFRDSVLHRRCIIPARQFYEWDSDRNRVTFSREDSSVLFMAGCYQMFQNQERFVILTTQANVSVEKVHDRMPVILEPKELEDWIYDDEYLEFALRKTPVLLKHDQEYEQLNLFS
ncbi:MAG: SOS response-associated peptidase [Fusicatenibacter sp.]|nr:SOS response-associated peptidase [Fusicatenibacter sp.]